MGVCDVRTLFRLCIDSSHADRLHEACSSLDSTSVDTGFNIDASKWKKVVLCFRLEENSREPMIGAP